MSEDENRKLAQNEEPQDEVEGHAVRPGAADEGEQEGGDDFEAHRHNLKARPGMKG
ncbi:MAG TPA: hypothetical protein VFL60_04300 [Gaiellaceae bacterium]|nr:hypothetical protein [Gaiellaceae bacterium]